jgi:biotin carboxylase
MIRILILGGGIMQMPAVRIAKGRKWRVAVADADPKALARDICDEFEIVDLKDRAGILAFASRMSANCGLNGVFTAGTDFSSTVSWVCERLGLPGIPFKTAMKATDKYLMRQAFADAGVPSPRFACWTRGSDPAKAAENVPFPVVVKPVDNMGARGVMRIDAPEGLAEACEKAAALSRSSRVIIEEYMEGPELSLDAIVYQGEITVCGIADRLIRFEPYFVEMGHTIPTALDDAGEKAVEEVFKSGIKAIGIDNGAAKGDIKLTPSGPKIGEIAARLSGGYMSGWTFPFSCGVDVTGAALNIAVGLPPGDLRPKFQAVSAERAIISIPGTVGEVEGADAASESDGVREIFLRVRPGSRVVFPTNNVEKCGNVIAARPSREEAAAAAEGAVSRVLIRLNPFSEETDRFLFGPEDDGRSAFTLSEDADKMAVTEMPPYLGEVSETQLDFPIRVLPLPKLSWEKDRDWHGLSIQDAVVRLLDTGCVVFTASNPDDDFTLGRVFWKALLRGGVQGALYVLDGLRAGGSGKKTAEYISRVMA